jgi:hypothetical protein
MEQGQYSPPVAQLLTLGAIDPLMKAKEPWHDYRALGLGPEHIPELIALATSTLSEEEKESDAAFAPWHACRALGQLGAKEAVAPLLRWLGGPGEEGVDDLMDAEALPGMFARLGPEILPALLAYLEERGHPQNGRITVVDALGEMAREHPEAAEACKAALVQQLERFEENDAEYNAQLVFELTTLKAVEAAPVIERAFAAGQVDEGLPGDWEEVQVALGLKTAPPAPRLTARPAWSMPPQKAKPDPKVKQKRKQEKAARRKNRKKK